MVSCITLKASCPVNSDDTSKYIKSNLISILRVPFHQFVQPGTDHQARNKAGGLWPGPRGSPWCLWHREPTCHVQAKVCHSFDGIQGHGREETENLILDSLLSGSSSAK